MKLLRVDDVEQAKDKLLCYAKKLSMRTETVPLIEACGRTLAQDITSCEHIPAFRRSTMDGYAVCSPDTAAAGESLPVFLSVTGEVEMGKQPACSVKSGQCVQIPTGAMLPEGADAVVMIENCEPFGDGGIAVYSSVAFDENTVDIGEDAHKGDILLLRGLVLRPQEIGVLAAAGVVNVEVYAPLRLAVISTGDELVDPGEDPKLGQVRDINTYALCALAEKSGYVIVETHVVKDDIAVLTDMVKSAMPRCDVVAVSGGSSQGKKDATYDIIRSLSNPGVFTHGMAIKPGKPTILGFDEKSETILAGLPGHPVSAMMVFETLFGWLSRQLTNTPAPLPVPAKMSINMAGGQGRMTCQLVRLVESENAYIAEPVFGKSGLITTLSGADGYIVIDRNKEGVKAGEPVLVFLFD